MKSNKIQINEETLEVFEDGTILKNGVEMKQSGSGYEKRYKRIQLWTLGKNKSIEVQRLVARAFIEDFDPSLQVHHINGNPSDNRASNLRMVTNSENSRSHRRKSKGKSSRFRGVSMDKNKWRVTIAPDPKSKPFVKCGFNTEEEAAEFYNEKAVEFGYDDGALNVL